MYIVEYTPVGAPRDGGNKANVREEDGIIFDAIQGIVHLTEWQSVQLELELHLAQRQQQQLTRQSIKNVHLPNHLNPLWDQWCYVMSNTT